MRRTLTAVAALAVAGAAVPAAATTIMIDDFAVDHSVSATQSGNPASAVATGDSSQIIGESRYVQVQTNDPDEGDFATNTSTPGDVLRFANDPGVLGNILLVYDGNGAAIDPAFSFAAGSASARSVIGANITTNGLGGVNLLGGGNLSNFFNFSIDQTDVDGEAHFWAYAWDMDGRGVEYYELIEGDAIDENLPLFAFSMDGVGDPFGDQGGFMWENVGALAFSLESISANYDARLAQITMTVVPLPASALLLLGGLGGFAGVAAMKRRRKTA